MPPKRKAVRQVAEGYSSKRTRTKCFLDGEISKSKVTGSYVTTPSRLKEFEVDQTSHSSHNAGDHHYDEDTVDESEDEIILTPLTPRKQSISQVIPQNLEITEPKKNRGVVRNPSPTPFKPTPRRQIGKKAAERVAPSPPTKPRSPSKSKVVALYSGSNHHAAQILVRRNTGTSLASAEEYESDSESDEGSTLPLLLDKLTAAPNLKHTRIRHKREFENANGVVARKASVNSIPRDMTPHPPLVTPTTSPTKSNSGFPSPSKHVSIAPTPAPLSSPLSPDLESCLYAQKKAVLYALRSNTSVSDLENDNGDDEVSTNEMAKQQLKSLLNGCVARGEGNSCLLLGPRGSGKTRLIEECIADVSEHIIVVRLSGWVHTTDRLALREIAYQLCQQTNQVFHLNPNVPEEQDIGDLNPFIDPPPDIQSSVSLPPSSHLPALISLLPTLHRPVVILMDVFDLFALHPRQSLLYCLLDTVQSCRAGTNTKGVAVIGLTSRLDTVQLLEKRVKSRFSGRSIRTAPPRNIKLWFDIISSILQVEPSCRGAESTLEEWNTLWIDAVLKFLVDPTVIQIFKETYSITRDVRMLFRLLTSTVVQLTAEAPFPNSQLLLNASAAQRARPRSRLLPSLSYPSICFLIASVHAETAGHKTFTFEMLFDCFREHARASVAAPVQINGGAIGMMRCTREVFMSAFEGLISAKILVRVSPSSLNLAREFVKYRITVAREDLKKAVDKMGQISLKKWLHKAQ